MAVSVLLLLVWFSVCYCYSPDLLLISNNCNITDLKMVFEMNTEKYCYC